MILNEKVSTTDKNNTSDSGQDNNGEEEDQCAAEEDCRVEETTDELIEWIACNIAKAGGILAALTLIMIQNYFYVKM